MKVLCIGHACYDICSFLDEYPVENKKYEVTHKIENGGGQAANAACLLGKWGIETYLSAAVGSDAYGEKIKKELEMHRVNTSLIETNFDKETSLAQVIINKKNASRTILNLTSQDKKANVKKTEFGIEPEFLLFDGYEYQATIRSINKYPNAVSVIDAGSYTPEIIELSKYCKYIIASQDFAEGITKMKLDFSDPTSLLNVYNTVKQRYVRNELIITIGDKGIIYSLNNEIKVMPALCVNAKDTTGAGDVFHGTFMYGLVNNYDFEKNIRYSIIASGLSCAEYGGRVAIPALNNVTNYYNSKFESTQNVVPQSTES